MVLCDCRVEVCEFEKNTDLFCLIKETTEVEALLAKARVQSVCPKFYQKVAYRAYIHHRRGFIDRGVIVPPPSCLVDIIRGEWMALNSCYVGYHEAATASPPAKDEIYPSTQEDKAASSPTKDKISPPTQEDEETCSPAKDEISPFPRKTKQPLPPRKTKFPLPPRNMMQHLPHERRNVPSHPGR
jgi:hypothetical protein